MFDAFGALNRYVQSWLVDALRMSDLRGFSNETFELSFELAQRR